jgi:hypothetical protein
MEPVNKEPDTLSEFIQFKSIVFCVIVGEYFEGEKKLQKKIA